MPRWPALATLATGRPARAQAVRGGFEWLGLMMGVTAPAFRRLLNDTALEVEQCVGRREQGNNPILCMPTEPNPRSCPKLGVQVGGS